MSSLHASSIWQTGTLPRGPRCPAGIWPFCPPMKKLMFLLLSLCTVLLLFLCPTYGESCLSSREMRIVNGWKSLAKSTQFPHRCCCCYHCFAVVAGGVVRRAAQVHTAGVRRAGCGAGVPRRRPRDDREYRGVHTRSHQVRSCSHQVPLTLIHIEFTQEPLHSVFSTELVHSSCNIPFTPISSHQSDFLFTFGPDHRVAINLFTPSGARSKPNSQQLIHTSLNSQSRSHQSQFTPK